eukprot:364139-Chlamydomonas_euryale.AAC.3
MQNALAPERKVGLDQVLSVVPSVTHVYVSNDLQVWQRASGPAGVACERVDGRHGVPVSIVMEGRGALGRKGVALPAALPFFPPALPHSCVRQPFASMRCAHLKAAEAPPTPLIQTHAAAGRQSVCVHLL